MIESNPDIVNDNKIYFFDEMELLNFCKDPKKYGYGVLHQNLNRKSKHLNMLCVNWSPSLCFVEKIIYNGEKLDQQNPPADMEEQ